VTIDPPPWFRVLAIQRAEGNPLQTTVLVDGGHPAIEVGDRLAAAMLLDDRPLPPGDDPGSE